RHIALLHPPEAIGTRIVGAILVDGSSLFIAGNGTDNSGSYRLWRVEKRNVSSGGLVPAFGTDGVVQLPSPDGDAKVMGALLVDGHLYLTGYDHPGTMSYWRTERRDPVTGDL